MSTGGFHRFSALVEQLMFTPGREAQLGLMQVYFQNAPKEDRGYALALLTGQLKVDVLRPGQIRKLAMTHVDPVLFRLSQAYVGDMGETVALLWPTPAADAGEREVGLGEIVQKMKNLSRLEVMPFVDRTLSKLEETERWVLVKLITGSSLRVGVSARLARVALARAFDRHVDEVERVWSFFDPPYRELFEWLEGRGAEPTAGSGLYFHPVMLATALEEKEFMLMRPEDWAVEWKWDGIRVQLCGDGTGRARLFTRSGEDISAAFPEVLDSFRVRAVVDGELLAR